MFRQKKGWLEMPSPIVNRTFQANSEKSLRSLSTSAGDSAQCLRVVIVTEIPLEDIFNAEDNFNDAIETLQAFGAAVITDYAIVDKEW